MKKQFDTLIDAVRQERERLQKHIAKPEEKTLAIVQPKDVVLTVSKARRKSVLPMRVAGQ